MEVLAHVDGSGPACTPPDTTALNQFMPEAHQTIASGGDVVFQFLHNTGAGTNYGVDVSCPATTLIYTASDSSVTLFPG